MKYAISDHLGNKKLRSLFESAIYQLELSGDKRVSQKEDPDYIINFLDMDEPRSFRRNREEQRVISVTIPGSSGTDLRSCCFKALVKSLTNLLFCVYNIDHQEPQASYSTPEAGFVQFPYSGENIYNAMLPVIRSHFVLRNRLKLNRDLTENEIKNAADRLSIYSAKLDDLGVLPAPFPLKSILDKDQIELLYRLYRMRGLSYGNMSLRRKQDVTGETAFWMSARGVNKARIRYFGHDFLLVDGYDKEAGEMLVSVSSDHDPSAQVSVDAIEHYLIYEKFPEVGAIVHIHAWMDGVKATDQNYPCGTYELASSVLSLLEETDQPGDAVIGLKNHGITITGPNLDNIFSRIKGKVKIQVPMKF